MFQSIASVFVSLEALMIVAPDIYIDTTGCAFTYLVFKLIAQCRVVAYVHYPTISSDMLAQVQAGTVAFNNRPRLVNAWLYAHIKNLYYRLFERCYWLTGKFTDCVMVNSTWTRNHIELLW